MIAQFLHFIGRVLIRAGFGLIDYAETDPIDEIVKSIEGDIGVEPRPNLEVVGHSGFSIPPGHRGFVSTVVRHKGRGGLPVSIPEKITYPDGSSLDIRLVNTSDQRLREAMDSEHDFKHGYHQTT